MRKLTILILFIPVMSWSLDLKQSTAVTLEIGPFVDAADGVTPETGLGLADDIEISKNGAPFATVSSASLTHDSEGFYRWDVGTGTVDTLGPLVIKSVSSGVHVPVWLYCEVLPSNVWDSLYSTDKLQVDVTQVSGSAEDLPTATNLATVDTVVDGIQTDLDNATDGLGALKTLIDAAQSTLDGLNDLSAADVAGELATYDGPTKAEMDSGFAGLNDLSPAQLASATAAIATLINALNDLSAAQVNAEVDTAFADYDPPTKTELDSGFAALNDLSSSAVAALIAAGTEDIRAVSDEFGSGGGGDATAANQLILSASVNILEASALWMQQVMESDEIIGSATPYVVTNYVKGGTSTVLIQKALKDINGNAVTDLTTTPVARKVENE